MQLASAKAWGGGAVTLVFGASGVSMQAGGVDWVATGARTSGSSQTAAYVLSGWAYWTAHSRIDLTGHWWSVSVDAVTLVVAGDIGRCGTMVVPVP